MMSEKFKNELKNYTFTLADLPEIVDKKVSIGEILSVSRAFQNLNEIDKFFSTLLDVKFIKEIKRTEVVLEEGSYTLSNEYPISGKSHRHDIPSQLNSSLWCYTPKLNN